VWRLFLLVLPAAVIIAARKELSRVRGSHHDVGAVLTCPDPLGAPYVWTHSYRSATRGSTRVARRAGIQQASSAITASKIPTAPKVTGSFGLTPTKRFAMARVPASASSRPIPRPMLRTPTPCFKSIFTLKMVVLTAIPSASVMIPITANPGLFPSVRIAYRRSFQRFLRPLLCPRNSRPSSARPMPGRDTRMQMKKMHLETNLLRWVSRSVRFWDSFVLEANMPAAPLHPFSGSDFKLDTVERRQATNPAGQGLRLTTFRRVTAAGEGSCSERIHPRQQREQNRRGSPHKVVGVGTCRISTKTSARLLSFETFVVQIPVAMAASRSLLVARRQNHVAGRTFRAES
jgi:hypothetical protein